MNDLLNISSEIPHLHLPNSCIHNSLRQDEHSVNSFSSIRAGSVTVTGKKSAAHNCLSPTSLQRQSKLPIPLQTLSRIKKQNSQVKRILKKHTKASNCPQPISPKIKSKGKGEDGEKVKGIMMNTKNSGRDESPKSFVQNENCIAKLPLKMKMYAKKEGKGKGSGVGEKSKNRIERMLNLDFEKLMAKEKVVKGIVVDTKSLTPRGKIEVTKLKLKKKKTPQKPNLPPHTKSFQSTFPKSCKKAKPNLNSP